MVLRVRIEYDSMGQDGIRFECQVKKNQTSIGQQKATHINTLKKAN